MADLNELIIKSPSWVWRAIAFLLVSVWAGKAAIAVQTFGTVAVRSTSAPVGVAFTMPTIVGSASVSIRGTSDFKVTGPVACNVTYCSAPVTFSPSTSGLRKAALVVTDSTPKANTVALLSGIGSAPQLTISPGTISISVGVGPPTSSGYGQPSPGVANETKMQTPQALALDSIGNLYIADSLSNVVVKYRPADGTLSVVAGAGPPGYTGDGGPAAQATLSGPGGVAVDAAGNVFIADTGNNVVRVVHADTQIIDTFAGGGSQSGIDGLGDGEAATDAMLSGPSGVAADIYGNVYIADTFNSLIRKVDSSGIISLLAGCAPGSAANQGSDGLGDGGAANSATLSYPTGLNLDVNNGKLFIADTYNNLIRMVDLDTSRISAVAGNLSSGYSGDGSLAVNATLNAPNAIDLDAAGNLYIADSNNNAIRRVNAITGIIETIAGVGTEAGYTTAGVSDGALIGNPYGLVVDSSGDIYIADYTNYVVEKISTGANQVYQFPDTIVGQSSSLEPQEVNIVNTGNASLNVQNIQLSGNFQMAGSGSVCSPQMTLNAGDRCRLSLLFSPLVAGTISGVMQIDSNSENENSLESIAIEGLGVPSLAVAYLSASTLAFGSQQIGTTSPVQNLVLSNTGSTTLVVTGVATSGDFAATNECGAALAPGTQCTIAVTFGPKASGIRTGVITISDNATNSPQRVALTGVGAAIANLLLSATTVDCGVKQIGSGGPCNSTQIAASNTGAAPLSISSIQLGGANAADFSIASTCQSVLAAQASCWISVLFSPLAAGVRSASVIVADNLENSPQTITITGTGTLASAIAAEQAHYYAGNDLHVHQLYFTGGTWQDTDLTVIAQGPNISGTAIVSVNDTIENAFKVHYIGVDQHVHQIYVADGGWQDVDLTLKTGGPNAVVQSGVASFVDTIENELCIDYIGIDQHIHQLDEAVGLWRDLDLTSTTGGSLASAGSPIASFVDTVYGVPRVNYTGVDQHVHQFYVERGAWRDFDLTAATGAPNVAGKSSIANFVDTIYNVPRINYIGTDQHVHQFYIDGFWRDYDLTRATQAPNAAAVSSIANFTDTVYGVPRINYLGVDRHIHQFYVDGTWRDYDLTAGAEAAIAAEDSQIFTLVDTTEKTVRIDYTGVDRHLHEFYVAGGWRDLDLTAVSSGLNVAGIQVSIANFTDNVYNVPRINYSAFDGQIHEFYLEAGVWRDYDFSGSGGPNIAAASSIANFTDTVYGVPRINYVGIDQHVHQLYVDGAWRDYDLTAATGAPNAAAGSVVANFVDSVYNVPRISYIGVDQHVHQFYVEGAWRDYDLTAVSGGPNAAAGSAVTNFVDTAHKTPAIAYVGVDRHVHQFYVAQGGWRDLDLTATVRGPNAAANSYLASFADNVYGVPRINYVGTDQHLHQFYVEQGAWHDYDLTAATGAPDIAVGSLIANFTDTVYNVPRVEYIGIDQHVHQFYVDTVWRDNDLTAITGAPNGTAGTAIANFVDPAQNTIRIDYNGVDRHVHELYFAGAWHHRDLTSATAASLVE